jgi:hypothetical protein
MFDDAVRFTEPPLQKVVDPDGVIEAAKDEQSAAAKKSPYVVVLVNPLAVS